MAETNLTFYRVPKKEKYTVISNFFLEDPSISGTAKGVLAYILSCDRKKNDWILYKQELIKHFADGKDSINTALKNLEEKGYLEILKVRKGRKTQLFFTVYEIPKEFFERNFSTENHVTEKSCADFQNVMSGISLSKSNLCEENPPLLNTLLLNTTTNYSEESSSSRDLRKIFSELKLCVSGDFFEKLLSFAKTNNLSEEEAGNYIRWICESKKKTVSNMNSFIYTTACKENLLNEYQLALKKENEVQKRKTVFCKHCGKEQTFQEIRENCCHGCGKDYIDFSQFANIHALQH
ncbi:MAG: helix-turn-helix domain-containing protein [Treponema sp.]|nr:helix-turn-helix domain-containing protein [Treponema sp.]